MEEVKVSETEAMPPPAEPSKQEIEKEEEKKLKSKFPGMPTRPLGAKGAGGHSAFLQKRFAKGQKFFDSGDYQMAKQKGRMAPGLAAMPSLSEPPTGEAHPTPETVPCRKTSILQQVHGKTQGSPS
jgi:hypothetical protein